MTLKDRGGDAPVLECRSVERRFSGIVALNGIDMCIERGEIFGLVGPNGCGKTTLTNAITGFYPPQRGRILLNGRDIRRTVPWLSGRRTQTWQEKPCPGTLVRP